MGFQVKINQWQAVANWTWNAGDDMCGICRAPFDGNPPEAKYPGDDAPVVWGVCSHAFHIQCINRWLSSQTEHKCPFCRRQWEFKQAETSSLAGNNGTTTRNSLGQDNQYRTPAQPRNNARTETA